MDNLMLQLSYFVLKMKGKFTYASTFFPISRRYCQISRPLIIFKNPLLKNTSFLGKRDMKDDK